MAGYAEVEPVKNEKGCWYKITVWTCPICGSWEEHRTRQPAPAPPLLPGGWREREINEAWDYCDAL